MSDPVNPIVRLLRSPALIRVCRIGVGLVMLAAALAKIGDTSAFASQIHHFRLIPPAADNLLAMTLPWVELLIGLALVTGVRARSGAWLSAGLMGVFTVAVALAVARKLDIECGCFGTADATRVGTAKLLENLGLTAAAAVASLRLR
ncbi:MAG TPA: MauE/DoxX family redox-associated membrane protein [Candidatus Eisenbacteria bacterium]